jgi:ammonia channel protein AmtB
LINLGPRVGKFNADGSANDLPGHNMPMTLVGLMMIIVGFWGFLMACAIFPNEGWSWSTSGFTSIYGTPLTLSALTFNILMGFAGGIIGAWMVSRDPFWMMSGALGGIISCAAGLDLWWPPLAFAVGFIGGAIMPSIARFVERMGIDDAVGAFTVHGALGVWGVLAVGIFAAGYPAIPGEGVAMTNFMGQLIGAVVMVLCGLVPGYVLSLIMKSMGVLRVPESAEIAGLDATKVPSKAYPEGMSGGSTAPAE